MSQSEPFTIVVPIKGTDKERKFMKKSLLSAVVLRPDELLIAMDDPIDTSIRNDIEKIFNDVGFTNYQIKSVPKSESWNFQLAHIIWHCYHEAKYDKILSYDIDSELRNDVMLGLNQIGKNNVAVVSFTKKLLIKTIGDLIRFIFYRYRVKNSDYVFSGVYWIYRPFYFANVIRSKYSKIYNGVDTIMCNEILANKKHQIITRKEMGVNCFDYQNEDYPWRQFQDGVWIGANEKRYTANRQEILNQRKTMLQKRIDDSMLRATSNISRNARRARLLFPRLKLMMRGNQKTNNLIEKYIDTKPVWNVLIKSIVYWHPYLLKGYLWAKSNQDSETVKIAKSLSFHEWGYQGNKYIPIMKWNRHGTGYT